MLIRCLRCQALFYFQESVAAGGTAFRVECGRCLEVFEAAVPKRIAPAELQGPVQVRPVAPRKPASPPGALERQALSIDEMAKALKPRRNDVEQPEEGELEKELRKVALRHRRLVRGGVALGLLILLGGIFAGLHHRFSGLPGEAAVRIEKARQKILRDDLQSLEQAAALFTEAARLAPGEAMPEAERAFALLLLAATHKDLADRLETAVRELTDRAAKVQLEKPEGWEKTSAQLAEQVAQISAEREPHARDASRLLQQGVAAAKASLDEDSEDPAALRAMALYCALAGAAERGARYLEQAEKRAPQDPLLAYTRAVLALSGGATRDKQDRALLALAVARQSEPRLLRALVDVAAISLDRQEPGPARDGLGKVLEENPHHERAKRLLALLPVSP